MPRGFSATKDRRRNGLVARPTLAGARMLGFRERSFVLAQTVSGQRRMCRADSVTDEALAVV